jgi:hypothetical protein
MYKQQKILINFTCDQNWTYKKNWLGYIKTCVTRRYEKRNCKKSHVWMRNAHEITSLIIKT